MRVIINADDLGASERVNDAVFEMMSAKRVTSATLIANGPCVKDAVKNIPLFPECSFGVHLNISEYRPLVSQEGIQAILNENGFFLEDDRIRKVKINPFLSQAVYTEFCAQTEKLISLGVAISHIDSHQHVHTIPGLFFILKKIQKRYGIKKVRISRNIYEDNLNISRALLLKKSIYNFMLRNCYKAKTTSGFTDFVTFYQNSKFKKIGYETIEIMVHPGVKEYEDETVLLGSNWQKHWPYTITLINYNEL